MKIRFILFFSSILIFVDQCTKLIINLLYQKRTAIQTSIGMHIHPQVNAEGVNSVTPIAEFLQLDVQFVLVVRALISLTIFFLIVSIWIGIHHFFFWGKGKKTYALLNSIIISFAFSGVICSYFLDELIYGGSLDWICFSWCGERQINNHEHLMSYHLAIDIKDIYILIAIILFFVRMVLFALTYHESSLEERKEYTYRGRRPVKNIRNMITFYKGKTRDR